MNAVLEQWGALFKTPHKYLDLVNMDEMTQLFRTIAPYDMKAFEDFIYLNSDLMNSKKLQRLWLQQMGIAFEMNHQTVDYMQKSVHLMQQSMLCLMENVYTHHRTDIESVNK